MSVHPFDPAAPLAPSECDIESMELAHALRLPPGAVAEPFLHLADTPPIRPGSLGLCWRGGDWDPARSVPFAELAPLLQVADGRLWSLQLGEGGRPFVNAAGCGPDVGQTARLVTSLDRIVTIDSMVAHLAGALGRPALVLLHAQADWRWGDDPCRCGLYPTHTLLRQTSPGRWDDVLARAAEHLTGKAQGFAPC